MGICSFTKFPMQCCCQLMFESWAARERECREGTLVSDLRSRVSCLQTGITWLTRAGRGKVISLHTQTAATRGGHKEHNPSIYPPVQSLASGIKTHPAKKPRAESLDRCEVIKDPSGLGVHFHSELQTMGVPDGEE